MTSAQYTPTPNTSGQCLFTVLMNLLLTGYNPERNASLFPPRTQSEALGAPHSGETAFRGGRESEPVGACLRPLAGIMNGR